MTKIIYKIICINGNKKLITKLINIVEIKKERGKDNFTQGQC